MLGVELCDISASHEAFPAMPYPTLTAASVLGIVLNVVRSMGAEYCSCDSLQANGFHDVDYR